MAELALDHNQRYAFASHLDRMRVAQLVRCKPATNSGRRGEAAELRAGAIEQAVRT